MQVIDNSTGGSIRTLEEEIERFCPPVHYGRLENVFPTLMGNINCTCLVQSIRKI